LNSSISLTIAVNIIPYFYEEHAYTLISIGQKVCFMFFIQTLLSWVYMNLPWFSIMYESRI